MKNSLAGIGLAYFFLAAGANGQEAPQIPAEEKTQIGIGIGLEPAKLFLTSSASISSVIIPVSIFLPIRFGSDFRLEPEIGMFNFSSETSSGSSTSSSDGSLTRIGIGALFTLISGENYNLYVGPRVGLYLSSTKSGGGSSSTETSETDLSIGLTIGSEYFMTPHLSFGGEAQVNYVSFGDPETTYTPAPPFPVVPSDRTRSFIWSNAIFLFRWYF